MLQYPVIIINIQCLISMNVYNASMLIGCNIFNKLKKNLVVPICHLKSRIKLLFVGYF